MSIYNYEQAFGAWDKTSPAMRRAIDRWFAMYYDGVSTEQADAVCSLGVGVAQSPRSPGGLDNRRSPAGISENAGSGAGRSE